MSLKHINTILTLATVFLWQGSMHAQARRPLPPIDLNEPLSHATSPASHPCRGIDLNILSLRQTKSLLADYDLDGPVPWTCNSIDLAWLRTARILRLSAALGLDNYREVTLLMASPTSRVWLIPIERGMIGYPNTEDNLHNIAAFNDLLRTAKSRPNNATAMDFCNLYQFLVGMDVRADPARAPKTLREAMQVNDVEGTFEHKNGFFDVTHREPFGDRWNHNYMIWEFRFSEGGMNSRLVDVSRNTLAKFEEDQ